MHAQAANGLTPMALARLIAGQICLHACMSGMRLAAPLMALRAGDSPLAVGVLMALFALTQVFLALPAGRYVDRHGFRRPLRWCVIAAGVGMGLAFIFPVFPVLCAGALLTGGATGMAAISLQRYVGRSAQNPVELKSMFGWLSTGPALANFIGPLSAGVLIDQIGFRLTYLGLACLPVVTWLCVRHTAEQPPMWKADSVSRGRAWDLMREPMMRRLMLVNWLLSSCWDVHTFIVPVLGHEHGLSASVIGSILGGFALAATGVRVVLPLLAAHVHEWVVVTTAIGGGYSDAAQHSQCLYATFAHMPGLKVVVPSNAYDAKGLMTQAIRDNNPVVFMFHKGIMGLPWMSYLEGSTNEVPQEAYTIPFGKAKVVREGRDVTIVTLSQMVQKAVLAAETLAAQGIDAEIVDLRTVVPLDRETILASVSKTGRLLVADEDYLSFGLSGEIAALVAENLDILTLKTPVRRLAVPDVPIPYSRPLEQFVIPQVANIVQQAQALMVAPKVKVAA